MDIRIYLLTIRMIYLTYSHRIHTKFPIACQMLTVFVVLSLQLLF